ncbi:MAG: FliI/YscN family ATPase [Acidobacteriaceae bacterium]|nr:FliI/YscN family ATPase [Acidobacteriaceae bacterium]
MTQLSHLQAFLSYVETYPAWQWQGRIVEATSQLLVSEGPPCAMGEVCRIAGAGGVPCSAEVVGFRGSNILLMPMVTSHGIRSGDVVFASGTGPEIVLGQQMLGRVLDAEAKPLDVLGPLSMLERVPLDRPSREAMRRVRIQEPLSTGVRAIDGMLTVGRGQRVGLFGGSGVGKSTLIGMMTRSTSADVIVVGLIGERGREVREFLEDALGEEGLARAVVFVSTADESPLRRMRAAQAATAAAEFYAAQGNDVLLVVDSLTRYAMAAREVGLAAGEPPATKGYTPSVFAHLAKLVERAGRFERGSITAFYTVLMEGDDQQDPIVDSVRSLLDGHVVLSRELASQGWYPPIQILDSLSRLMPAVSSTEHREKAMLARRLLASYKRSEDLIRLGAYAAGSDPELDRAMAALPALKAYLQQRSEEAPSFAESVAMLEALAL